MYFEDVWSNEHINDLAPFVAPVTLIENSPSGLVSIWSIALMLKLASVNTSNDNVFPT